ncbi:MAG: hypothetical protein QXT26_06085 [Thermoproteota archaeon]
MLSKTGENATLEEVFLKLTEEAGKQTYGKLAERERKRFSRFFGRGRAP